MTAHGKVLIVDDDESMREACAQTLEAEGFTTASAAGAEEAVATARLEAFDVALSAHGKVLIVGDDESMREACAQTLEAAGFTTASAAGAEEAVATARLEAFDVALVDVLPMKAVPA